MTSLIEGWFEPVNGRPYVDDSLEKGSSSRKDKSYLIVYDACAALGSLSSGVFADCEIWLWPGNQMLEEKVIHIHGRFSVVTAPGEDDPCLKVDVHHFVVMHANDSATHPNPDPTPLEVRTSVTLCGQVTSITNVANDGGANKFFGLEVSDYVRDCVQMFHIRCRLNNSNKRWEKTPLPAHGSTVLISGYLCGESAKELLVEVETMQFITQARVSEVGRSPQTPGSSKFGTPKSRARRPSDTLMNPPSSSPPVIQDQQVTKPLSMLPIPVPPVVNNVEAGPSTPTVLKRTRAGGRRLGKGVATTPATSTEPAIVDDEDSTPKRKKAKKATPKATPESA